MKLNDVFIPYAGYATSPFCRWQGSLSSEHPLALGAEVARQGLERSGIAVGDLDGLHLGTTVPSKHGFYGSPWVAKLLGAPALTGPTVSQACATSVRLLRGAAAEVETGGAKALLAVAADRTSNGPHLVYPAPSAPGGTPEGENWVFDNFGRDPAVGCSMLQTAENVAAEEGFSTAAQHDVTLLRHEQYQQSLADGAAFQRRYMLVPLRLDRDRRRPLVVEGDEGIHPTTAEGLARLEPVMPGGTVTYGGQTHPADGAAAVVVANRETARRLSTAPLTIQIVAFGEARTRPGFMPEAAVPAARDALEAAGLGPDDMEAFTLHDPFAVNDLYFCQKMGIDPEAVNRYGGSLVWGHPQAPTGLRGVMELVEALAVRGGGCGLFSGCSAGDSAAAVVVRVDDLGAEA